MCISTRWNNIMKDPSFLQSYSVNAKKRKEGLVSSKRLLAFIEIKREEGFTRDSFAYCNILSPFNSSTKIPPVPDDQTNNYKFDKVPKRLSYFIGCSNGLILCGHQCRNTYYILNPIRGTLFFLPPPKEAEYSYSMGLVCEENIDDLVPYFKVVRASNTREMTDTVSILTFSSRTGKWASSMLTATEKLRLHLFIPPVVVNGIFHWLSQDATLAVYDSNKCDNHIQLIRMPCALYYTHYPQTVTRSSIDGVLWFVLNTSECLELWMLPKDQEGGYKRSTTIPKTEWILMRTISRDSLTQKIVNCVDIDFNRPFYVRLEWLILRVLETIICLYDFETDSVEFVRHNTDPSIEYSYPYMESLSLSSYAL